jgi:hypothetical protein
LRSLVLLGLIAGISAGLALACAVGAQRTGTALARLQDRTAASDAIVFSSQAGVEDPDWSALAARPEVDELGPWALIFGDIEAGDDADEAIFAPVGGQFLNTVDRPVVVEGRMWDPAADDELVVGEELARRAGIALGFTTRFQPFVTADYDESGARTDDPPQGPWLEMTVVGIIRSPVEHLFLGDGAVFAPPGLLTRHPDIYSVQNASARLEDVPGAQAALLQDTEIDIAPGVPILDLGQVGRRVTTTTDVERTVLLALAFVIGIAGLVLGGQVLGRSASAIATDVRALQSLGMSRRSIAFAAAADHVPAALVAGAACAGAAVVASFSLPFGLAGQLDPDTGLRVHVLATAAGAAVVALLVPAAAFARAWVLVANVELAPVDAARGPVSWLRRHSSVVVGLGATMALRQARGVRGVPVRPALLGAVVGVLGVAGAATLDAGLDDAFDNPQRAGVVWDITVLEPDATVVRTEGGFSKETIDAVRAVPGVGAMAYGIRVATQVGEIGAPAFVLRPVTADQSIDLTVLDGARPRAPGEVAVGPETLRRLDARIGDEVKLAGEQDVRIVGTALFPHDVHAGFDEGIWLTPQDQRLLPDLHEDAEEQFLAVRLTDGADRVATVGALGELVGSTGAYAFPVEEPPELVNLRDVVPLPRWVGAFLAVLAAGALLHVLSSSARVRAHDFAVLRAIGMTRRATYLVVSVQGIAIFAVGLAVGVPAGIAAGRVGWRLIAENVPLEVVTPIDGVAVALLVPTALLVSQVVAVGPARRLRRLHPAAVLRTE